VQDIAGSFSKEVYHSSKRLAALLTVIILQLVVSAWHEVSTCRVISFNFNRQQVTFIIK